MDLVEIGAFWGGASKCKGPEVCLMGRKKGRGQLEQTGGLGGGGTRSEGGRRPAYRSGGSVRALSFI